MKSSILYICVLFSSLRATIAKQPCLKLDFDVPQMNGLAKCSIEKAEFSKKLYSNSRVIHPFRKGAQHYLSNRGTGISCGETLADISLDRGSVIQITNFLVFNGAAIYVRIRDLDQEQIVASWRIPEELEKWQIFEKYLDIDVPRAKIEANMNSLSTFAIEHLHVINQNIGTAECSSEEWLPSPTTTPDPTTTTPTATSIATSTVETASTTTRQSSSSSTSAAFTETTPEPEITSTSAAQTTNLMSSTTSTEITTAFSYSSVSNVFTPSTTQTVPESPPKSTRNQWVILSIIIAVAILSPAIASIFLCRHRSNKKYIVTPNARKN